MSWSVSAVGKPGPVGTKLAAEFSRITYLGEQEAALKDAIAEVVAKTIAANTRNDIVLNVTASGSGSTHPSDGSLQTVSMSVTQLYGFVE